MTPETIGAFAVALGGWGTALVGWLRSRRNDKADAAETVVQAALSLVEPLEARVKALEFSLVAANRRITILERENEALRSQLA